MSDQSPPAGGSVFCTSCGYKLDETDRFCPECGASRPSAPIAATAPLTPPPTTAPETVTGSDVPPPPPIFPPAGIGGTAEMPPSPPPGYSNTPALSTHGLPPQIPQTQYLVQSSPVPPPQGSTPPPQVNVHHATIINQQSQGHGCLVRGLWFWFIGAWASLIVLIFAYLLLFVSLGLLFPVTMALLNRMPKIMTLRERASSYQVTHGAGVTVIQQTRTRQLSWLIRVPYFILIGWWLVLIWISLAWLIAWLIITMPVTILMLDRVPAVATLQRN